MAETTVRLKLLIDAKAKRVLFAEAGKDCVDFLFNILSLPVATIVRLLRDQGTAGSLPNLYKSLEALDHAYIQPNRRKDSLLAPVSCSSPPLLPLQTGKTTFFPCYSVKGWYADPPGVEAAEGGGGIVKGVVTYMVMDDLTVTPMSAISSLTMLNNFDVKDLGALQEKVVTLGMNEAVKLLKASLLSNTVLTDVFYN